MDRGGAIQGQEDDGFGDLVRLGAASDRDAPQAGEDELSRVFEGSAVALPNPEAQLLAKPLPSDPRSAAMQAAFPTTKGLLPAKRARSVGRRPAPPRPPLA